MAITIYCIQGHAGVAVHYLVLKKAGEDRLLVAATTIKTRSGVAIDIAKADTIEMQRELLKAYESKQLNQASIRVVKRLIEHLPPHGMPCASAKSKAARSAPVWTPLIIFILCSLTHEFLTTDFRVGSIAKWLASERFRVFLMPMIRILREAIKAVPAVRYALGVAGLGATVAIILGFTKIPITAVVGIIVLLAFMTALVIFAKLTKSRSTHLNRLAIILAYVFVFDILLGVEI